MDIDIQKGWKQLEKWIRKERIGRRRFVQVNVLSGLIGFTVIFTPFLIIFLLPDFDSDFLMFPIASVGIAVAIVMMLTFIATSMARLRDMGRSSNWFVLGLIPYINAVFFIALALTEGKIAKNRAKREAEKPS